MTSTELPAGTSQSEQNSTVVPPVTSREGQTDLSNARRLVQMHHDSIRFCHAWSKWLVWDGSRWSVDGDGAVIRLAKQVADRVWVQAGEFGDTETRKFATKTASKHGILAMLTLAESDLSITPEEMDRDSFLLNVANGTIDLRTGELREHRRADCITSLCPVSYDANATGDAWPRFLFEVFDGDSDLELFVQRIFGYGVTGDVSEQVLAVLHGTGANGKSTLIDAVMDTLGEDYAIQAPRDLLMNRKGDSHPTELARLFGKRLVVSSETEDNRSLAESLVKQLTGGDMIPARRMREDFWQFKPTHKLILCTNHKPQVRGTDHAIWRRLKLVPFNVQFSGRRLDKTMPDKLRAERQAVLAWLVAGAVEWCSRGLDEPATVRVATSCYRSDSDIVGRFISERCVPEKDAQVEFGILYGAIEKWAEDEGENLPSKKSIGIRLQGKGFEKFHSGGTQYRGLRLLE